MRAELADVVGEVLHAVDPRQAITVTGDETDHLLAAADVVTLCRTAVDYDYRGDVIDAHAPEAPTRFAKQLVQIMRGGVAVGLTRAQALRLALRCARDSMPPLRLAILDDVAANPATRSGEVRRRLDKPWSTIDRQLQSLHILGVLTQDEVEQVDPTKRTVWRYRLAPGINPSALTIPISPELSPPYIGKSRREECIPTDISGDGSQELSGVV
jgi:hypothetical protein